MENNKKGECFYHLFGANIFSYSSFLPVMEAGSAAASFP